MSKKRSRKEEVAAEIAAEPVAIDAAPEELPPPVVSPELPKEKLPIVKLGVFAASGSIKWDQMAGFISYAQRKELAPRTIPEWRQAHADFQNRPVK